ncbi:MAG: outer membrane beta-barrel family protein, partial [Flammeovirgaceae bacterium]|nr:outer membrane beta-barrel family protein [Flammeovirgaceae bacterium]MDW8288053.1 outer membrane beta-barrel protein [Flammeovirgaceae bacterium]
TPKFYASYFGNWYTQQQKGTWELTRQKENHSSVFLRQKGDAEAQSVINSHNLQLSYDFNSSTTLSLNLLFFENDNSNEEKLNVRFANKNVPSRNYSNINTRTISGEIELSKKISEFSTVINTARFIRSSDYFLSGSDNAALQRNWSETGNDLQGNMYVYQLKHQWKPVFNRKVSLDYGILAVLNQYDAAFAFSQWNLSTKRLEKISALSLDTRFRQERGMFFLTTTFPWRKVQWQVGTRIEHVRNHFSNSESTLQQNFYNVIPRLKWMKRTATVGSFALSLSSFVKLPDFTLLNPYIQINNPNSSTAGNLHLKKETHYRIELTHDIDFKEGFLTLNSSVYHQLSNNEIVQRTNLSSSSDSVLVRFYDNIRQFSKTGASVSLRGFLDSWFLNITLHAERYAFDSPFVPVQNRNGFVWGTSLNINKTLRKYEFRLNASYENFTFDANARVYRLPSMGFGINRKWWNERIDTSVGITDIFNTIAKRRQVYYDGIYHQTYRSFYSIRFINFSVTYNFGKQIMFFKSSHGIQHATEMKK